MTLPIIEGTVCYYDIRDISDHLFVMVFAISFVGECCDKWELPR